MFFICSFSYLTVLVVNISYSSVVHDHDKGSDLCQMSHNMSHDM